MPKIGATELQKRAAILSRLVVERQPWRELWRDLADYYLPSRYRWLLSDRERTAYKARNTSILDNTGTRAARTLAAGMMNGVTSPARPWFKLRLAGRLEESPRVRVYLDEVERRMLATMAETNFYTALQTLFLDLSVFGTNATLIYEDWESVFRCYSPPLGEYCLYNSHRHNVGGFARTFRMEIHQFVERFPNSEYWSDAVKSAVAAGGDRLFNTIEICHLIEPNDGKLPGVPNKFRVRELYWEKHRNTANGIVLELRGFYEMPGIFPRWSADTGEAYGVSPGMDALGDVIQLQHESKRKAQALDKMVNPPIQAPVELRHKPTALLPGGVNYVSGLGSADIKPIYQVNPPLGEISADLVNVQTRIRETFHNDLFNMISQLETVRSATEIDARREEKLVLLGGVLERFENEALDPAINRVYGIMNRAGLLPDPPEEMMDAEIEVQYVSILSVAQKAVGTVPTERLLQLIGNIAPVWPEAREVPDIPELLRDYARDTGVKAKNVRTPEEVRAAKQQMQEQEAMQQNAQLAQTAADAGKNLAAADVGGGVNALQYLLGGA